jgi:hypothetical protein
MVIRMEAWPADQPGAPRDADHAAEGDTHGTDSGGGGSNGGGGGSGTIDPVAAGMIGNTRGDGGGGGGSGAGAGSGGSAGAEVHGRGLHSSTV